MTVPSLALAGILAAGGPGAALHVSLAPEEISVGDRIRGRITLAVGAETELLAAPELPLEEGGAWGGAEILSIEGPTEFPGTEDGARSYSWEVALTAWEPGSLDLPPLGMTLATEPSREIASRDPETIRVRSVLPEGEALEPRPPAPPRSWPAPSPWWWLLAPLGLLAVLFLIAWWRRRRGTEAPEAPVLAPRERLERELDDLRDADGSERIHTVLSLALRHYLERSLGFPAAEHTTTEIRRDLRATPLARDLQRDLLDLLRRCDDVKFARRTVPAAIARERIERVRKLADRVEEPLRPRSMDEEVAA